MKSAILFSLFFALASCEIHLPSFTLNTLKLKLTQKIVNDGEIVFTNCGNADSIVKNLNMVISPNPPVVGQDVESVISGNVTEELNDPILFNVSVIFGGNEMEIYSGQFCKTLEEAAGAPVCPINAGEFNLSSSASYDEPFPVGVQLKFTADKPNRNVFCFTIHSAGKQQSLSLLK